MRSMAFLLQFLRTRSVGSDGCRKRCRDTCTWFDRQIARLVKLWLVHGFVLAGKLLHYIISDREPVVIHNAAAPPFQQYGVKTLWAQTVQSQSSVSPIPMWTLVAVGTLYQMMQNKPSFARTANQIRSVASKTHVERGNCLWWRPVEAMGSLYLIVSGSWLQCWRAWTAHCDSNESTWWCRGWGAAERMNTGWLALQMCSFAWQKRVLWEGLVQCRLGQVDAGKASASSCRRWWRHFLGLCTVMNWAAVYLQVCRYLWPRD